MEGGQQKANPSEERRIIVYFRPAEVECDSAEYRGEIVFHSAREFVMCSPISLQTDSLLSFRLLVPLRVPGNPVCETRGSGRVLGERTLPGGASVYVIRIE